MYEPLIPSKREINLFSTANTGQWLLCEVGRTQLVILERSGHFKAPYDAPVIIDAYHSENDQPQKKKDKKDCVVSRPSWLKAHTHSFKIAHQKFLESERASRHVVE